MADRHIKDVIARTLLGASIDVVDPGSGKGFVEHHISVKDAQRLAGDVMEKLANDGYQITRQDD